MCLAFGVVGVLSTAPATADGVAVGTASASGTRTTYDLPGYLVVDRLVDGGGPVAQSVLNSSGGSTGFASLPYPGDTVVNAGAAASAGTGQPIPFSYPLYVIADGVLTPSAHEQDPTGTVELSATASDQKTTANAKGNGPQSGAVNTSGSVQHTSVVIGADGAMTCTGDSVTRGIDLGVLKISEVHVHSVTTLKPGDSKPSTTSTTQVVGASVAGQDVTITKDGITLAGNPQGAPYKPVLDNLNAALKQAGVSVALVGDTPVAGGQSASGLEIVQSGELPIQGSPHGTARTVVGNALSFIVGGSQALPVTPPPGTGSSRVTPPTHSNIGTAGQPLGNVGQPVSGPATGLAPGPVLSNAGADGPPSPVLAATRGTSLLAADLNSTFGFFYLVIALGAGVVLTSSILWRTKGVRAQWIS